MAAKGSRMLFPNLAVKDLDRSVAFFTELGFTFDERFTDDTATAMIVNDQAVVMLLDGAEVQGVHEEGARRPADADGGDPRPLGRQPGGRRRVRRQGARGGRVEGQRAAGDGLHVRAELPGSRRSPVGDLLDGPRPRSSSHPRVGRCQRLGLSRRRRSARIGGWCARTASSSASRRLETPRARRSFSSPAAPARWTGGRTGSASAWQRVRASSSASTTATRASPSATRRVLRATPARISSRTLSACSTRSGSTRSSRGDVHGRRYRPARRARVARARRLADADFDEPGSRWPATRAPARPPSSRRSLRRPA